jgi:peptidoglycan-associated lipoprotein
MKTSLALLTLVSAVLSACASTTENASSQVAAQETAANYGQPDPGAKVSSAAAPADVSSATLKEQMESLQKQSVYFGFNEFFVRPEYHRVIEQVADFMHVRQSIIVTLEGNTDERGSGEYNLSLGNRRADAVRSSLELLGISSSRIIVVSLGEEKPRRTCHEEQCWAENRRTDFILRQGNLSILPAMRSIRSSQSASAFGTQVFCSVHSSRIHR